MNSGEFVNFYAVEYNHETITVEEILNSGMGYYTVDSQHPWIAVSFKNGGITADSRMILQVTYTLIDSIHERLTNNGISYSVMRTVEDLILVFETPDDAIMAVLLCDE